MSSKKLAATLLLSFVLISQASLAALAEDGSDSSGWASPSARPTAPATFGRDKHEHHDDDHARNQFQVAVPPMVITPDVDDAIVNSTGIKTSKHKFTVAPPSKAKNSKTKVPDKDGNLQVIEPKTSAVDPNANAPIQMDSVHPNAATPADVFMNSAKIGVGAMAVGAIVLGATAAVRGARSKRESKTDFIYDVEAKPE
jgi:hypothetical protein